MKRLLPLAAAALCAGFMAYGCSESGGPAEIADVPTFTAQFNTTDGPFSVDLIADGGEMYGTEYGVKVGVVEIWNDFNNLYVKFRITDANWCITETHLHIATSPEEIPQANGNPKVGKFDYGEEGLACVTEWTFSTALDLGWADIVIAAHAVVWDMSTETTMTVLSDGDESYTAYSGPGGFSTAVCEDVESPRSGTAVPTWQHSAWVSSVNPVFASTGATWIWEQGPASPQLGRYYVVNHVCGDVVDFVEEFDVPGFPAGGLLKTTTDNGYEAYLNGNLVGEEGLSGDWRNSNLTEPYVTTDRVPGWETVLTHDLNDFLKMGTNTFLLQTANELMHPSDQKNSQLGAPELNPGGLIYVASIDYYEREETAWGAGTEFEGKNWATYITYTIQDCAVTNLINGGFESPVVDRPNYLWDIYDSGTTGLGWTVEWAGDYTGAPNPAHLELHRGVNDWKPKEGEQYAELDTDWGGPGDPQNNEPASVRIYQDLQTCPGIQYKVEFAWSPRPNHADNKLTAFWDDAQLGTEYWASGGSNTYWTLVITGPTATGTTTRLSFTETGTANSLGMFLDAVSVEPIQ